MNDFIADLDPSCSKDQVQLNEEMQNYIWISPLEALKLPLQRECRALIEKCFEKKSLCLLGIQQYQIPCIIGLNLHERLFEQTICIDAKIKVDLSSALISRNLKDSVDYVLIAKLCHELARQNKYFLLEILASDILDEALNRFKAVWAWVRVQKPGAIPNAACAFVEMERHRERGK